MLKFVVFRVSRSGRIPVELIDAPSRAVAIHQCKAWADWLHDHLEAVPVDLVEPEIVADLMRVQESATMEMTAVDHMLPTRVITKMIANLMRSESDT
jgi:hypothetical protein